MEEHTGQLGNGKYADKQVPTLVKSETGYLTNIIKVSAGNASSMAVDLEGNGYVWGDNSYNKLGKEEAYYNPPAKITKVQDKEGNSLELNKIENIEVGYNHSSISDEYGFVYSAGLNSSGELGTEDYDNRSIFTRIRK